MLLIFNLFQNVNLTVDFPCIFFRTYNSSRKSNIVSCKQTTCYSPKSLKYPSDDAVVCSARRVLQLHIPNIIISARDSYEKGISGRCCSFAATSITIESVSQNNRIVYAETARIQCLPQYMVEN